MTFINIALISKIFNQLSFNNQLIGHSMATIAEGEEAVKNGASFITHLFNAMLPVNMKL